MRGKLAADLAQLNLADLDSADDGRPAPASPRSRSGRDTFRQTRHRRFPTHRCVDWCLMGRTNVELDEELVTEAMRRYGLPTKRAAIDFALRRLVGDAMTRDEALAMEGTGWDADLDELRADRAAVLE